MGTALDDVMLRRSGWYYTSAIPPPGEQVAG